MISWITKCIQYALVEYRPSVSSSAECLRWCIGPPLKQSFAKLLGPKDEHLTDAALAKYRERISSVGLFENSLYAGIEVALDELKICGHSLGVATSKPTVYAERIVNHFGLKEYFSSVDGSELDGTRSDKTSLIAHILERDAIAPNDGLVIGDRKYDIIGARQNKVAGLGVLWGYGSREELEAAGACTCVALPTALPTIIGKLLSR